MEKATFAAGCFWGVEHCFNKHHRKNGITCRVGYCGGVTENPLYPDVKKDITGHAESIEIQFEPTKVSYAELVEFFYKMHDPTTLNYQGPDVGTQYRSVIFYHSEEQKQIAEKVTKEVQEKHYPEQTIVTLIVPAAKFWDAEEYHQLYLEKNPEGYELGCDWLLAAISQMTETLDSLLSPITLMTYVKESSTDNPTPPSYEQSQKPVPTLTPQQAYGSSQHDGSSTSPKQGQHPVLNQERNDTLAPQITNVADKDTVYQRVLLINGRAGTTENKFESTVTVVSHGFPTISWPCVDSHFKALVHLNPGPNTISFIFNGPYGPQTTHFHVTYIPLTQNSPLYLVIMLASDSPATFDVPPEKRHENTLNVAIEKFRMCAYMWQAFMSEQFYRNGMGRRALRLDERYIPDTISAQDAGVLRHTAFVHVVRSKKSLKEWRDLKRAQQSPESDHGDQDLYSMFIDSLREYGAPFDKPCTVAGLMMDSHWDTKAKVTRAHAALGGKAGDLALGIFGSHLLHAWPRNMEDIVPAFMNTTTTDTRYVANDANESGQWWKAANIGMGAMLHEVGHAHTLTHTATGIMSRGYNNWNRTFMVKEPGSSSSPIPPHAEEGSHWHRVDMIRLRFHPTFRIPQDGYWAPKSDMGPTIEPLEHNKLAIKAPAGLSMVELIVNGGYRTHFEWPEPSQQTTYYELNLDHCKKEARCGPQERLRIEATSCNSQTIVLDDVDDFLRKHIVVLPNVPGKVFKSHELGQKGLGGGHQSSVVLLQSPQRYITSILVHHGGFFDGMVFQWNDGSRSVLGQLGGGATEFRLKPGERVVKFVVRCGAWVDGLQMITSAGRITQWFGGTGGGLAEIEAPDGHELVGLYATAGQWMDSFGIMYRAT